MLTCLKAKKHERDETFFTENGGLLLEELVAFCNGRSNPIRHFSARELQRATNHYDERQCIALGPGYKMYEGSLKDRPIIVKKYNWGPYGEPYKDIAVGSQMSAHKNVLKVLGCCLETRYPIIVYEFAIAKCLLTCIFDTNVEQLTWKCRLRIAMDIANAVAYLHTAFSRPVVHRGIKPDSFILDENNVPKLIDFGLCISIPEGKSRVEDTIRGAYWYLAPEYAKTKSMTEKADVYGFGILLSNLSSGETIPSLVDKMEKDVPFGEQLSNFVHCKLTNEGIKQEQFTDFKTLLRRCISRDEEQRPTMIEVAKELRRIFQSTQAP